MLILGTKEELSMFPKVTGPSFSFVLSGYLQQTDNLTLRKFSLYTTAAGKTWSEMLSAYEGTTKLSSNQEISLRFTFEVVDFDDSYPSDDSVWTLPAMKAVISSMLRSLEQNGPIVVRTVDLPSGATDDQVKGIVRLLFWNWYAQAR